MDQFSNNQKSLLSLIIDTSRNAAWAALVRQRSILAEREWQNGPMVGKQILKELEEMLGDKGLNKREIKRVGVVVTAKRQYSSSRAGVTAANMLALALGSELVELKDEERKELVKLIDRMPPVSVAKAKYEE